MGRAGQGLGTTVEVGEGTRVRRTRGWSWRSPQGSSSQAKQISPELSALVVYCCATRLRTLRPAPIPPEPYQVSSLSERKAKKFIREAGRSWHIRDLGVGGWPTGSWWGQSYPDVGLERRWRGLCGGVVKRSRGAQGMSTQHHAQHRAGDPWRGEGSGREASVCLYLEHSLLLGPDIAR